MKKSIKLICSLFMFISLFSPMNVSANENPVMDEPKVVVNAKLIEINEETGEETVKIVEVDNSMFNEKNNSKKNESTSELEIFVPIETNNSISLFDSQSVSKEEAGVKASLTLTYTLNSNMTMIKITKFSGSWTYNSEIYTVSDRKAGCHDLTGWGHYVTLEPIGNSFTYWPSWDYVSRIYGVDGPTAFMDCTIRVIGMSGTSYRLELVYSLQ